MKQTMKNTSRKFRNGPILYTLGCFLLIHGSINIIYWSWLAVGQWISADFAISTIPNIFDIEHFYGLSALSTLIWAAVVYLVSPEAKVES